MKRINTRLGLLVVAMMLAVMMPILSGCDSEKTAAQDRYKTAVAKLDEKNEEIDAAIAELTDAMDSDLKPLDESTMDACEDAISAAQGAKVTAPEMANTTEEIDSQVAEIEGTDYSAQMENMQHAKESLENSIKQREQITNPSDAFIIQRLGNMEHIQSPTAVTEDMDPNGQLNKQGGYTATVYFLSDQINQDDVYVSEHDSTGNEVIDKGTEGGGAIEVYANEEDANKRNDYLSAFDGGIFSSGSHNVYGTCVIRLSDKLTASQQKDMEAAIVEALTKLE